MKNFKKMMENNWAAYTLATCSAVLLFVFLSNFSSFMNIVYSIEGLLFPIIIGAVLAYLLNPVVIFFEERALKKVKKDCGPGLCGAPGAVFPGAHSVTG